MRLAIALAALAALLPASNARAIMPSKQGLEDHKRFVQHRAERPQRRQPQAGARVGVSSFNRDNGGGWAARFDPRTGRVSALSGGAMPRRLGAPLQVAEQALRDTSRLTGVDTSQLAVERQRRGSGLTHILYKQTYKGLPVEFSRVKVHLADDGSVVGLNSTFEPDLGIGVDPSLSASEAFESVRREVPSAPPAPGELVIFPDEATGQARLAWKFSAREKWALWRYYVDAHTGQVLFRYDDFRRQVTCTTSGNAFGAIYDIDPSSSSAVTRAFANLKVYIRDGVSSAVTGPDGFFCSNQKGKVIASLQGLFANITNFLGPSAHWDNGSGVWSTIATSVDSPHPYTNNLVHITTVNLAGTAASAAVKVLPIFSSFKVGSWVVDQESGGNPADYDDVSILDADGNALGSYVGSLGSFRGPAVHGLTYRVRLNTNGIGTNEGYAVSHSSYLTVTDPAEWSVFGSCINWTTARTHQARRSEINLYYHLDKMHHYFMSDINLSSAAYIGQPVRAQVFTGPNLISPFYNPELDNLVFGDVNSQSPSDAPTDDASVPRHEYVHYTVEKIWTIQNFGQAGALSEAFADYFAASSLNFSSIGKFLNNSLGGTGALRELDCPTLTTCKVFSASNWKGEIHDDSIYVSQALWDIRKARIAQQGYAQGQSCADGLAFQSLLFFPESFSEFVEAMKKVDQMGIVASCGGANSAQAQIGAAFAAHGLPYAVGDGYERNDGFETAVDISTIGAISATIFPGADVDFYQFASAPGRIRITLDLPSSGNLFKAYALTLYNRQHAPVASAEPTYDFNSFGQTACEVSDCLTTQSRVTIDFSTTTADFYYLRVSGGLTLGSLKGTGSQSAVNSTSPYGLKVEVPRFPAFAGAISASHDNDLISFSVAVTTFVRVQNFSFACARLLDHALDPLPGIVALPASAVAAGSSPCAPAGGVSPLVAFVSSANALGTISGSLRLQQGFAQRFPAVGTVYLEAFGYNVWGSTASLGISQSMNLGTNQAEFKALNNLFRPAVGGKVTARYDIRQPGRVTIQLLTLSGTLVATLLDQEMPAGKGSVDWVGKNMNGEPVASGVYLLSLRAPGVIKTQKIVVVK